MKVLSVLTTSAPRMGEREVRVGERLRVVSFGGGVQSTALLVLAARGLIDFQTFLFANVGDDSEYPGTLCYVREVSIPYAEQHGLSLIELRRVRRDDHEESLLQRIHRS